MADDYKVPNTGDSGQMTETLVSSDGQEKKPKRAGGLKGAWQWFWESPWSRKPFAIFLLFAALTFIWLIMFFTDPLMGYILAGVSAIGMALYGANHFRILLGLKEEVDKMSKLNREFRAENAALKQEVDKLSKAREQLQDVESDLKESNARLKENLVKFRELDANLKQLAGSNLEGLEKVQKSSEAVMKRWNESLIRNEKSILNKVYDQFEFKDDKEDMSEEEFNEFLDALPDSYRKRYKRMNTSFKELAGEDGMMQYEEFRSLVDKWAEEIAYEGGSG